MYSWKTVTRALIVYTAIVLQSTLSGCNAAPEAPAVNTKGLVKPNLPSKKVIEYGWDVASPEFLRDNIRAMENRPFDGVMFRLPERGGHIFDVKSYDEAKLQPQLKVLSQIKWQKFTDNFLMMYADSNMDWYNDADWQKVLAHAKFCALAVKAAGAKGVVFDPEPYGANPWLYAKQAHASTKSFDEYAVMVRRRGAQFMRALQAEKPDIKIPFFYFYSRAYWFDGHDLDPAKRAERVNGGGYGLLQPFLDGMLEAAGPDVRFVDGNEESYYLKYGAQFANFYHVMKQGAKLYVAPELRAKYDAQVQAGFAVYIDFIFNLRPELFPNSVTVAMTPEERARWFEQNLYYGLSTADEYVWIYSERMNWWTDTVFAPGLEQGFISSKEKAAREEALGFDLTPAMNAALARLEARNKQ